MTATPPVTARPGPRAPVAPLLLLLLGIAWLFLPTLPASQAQAQNGISEPPDGAALSGIVIIRGTATNQSFLRYELAFNNGGQWIVFATGDRPVVDDTLAIWDTTIGRPGNPVFPDGNYQLRLRVVRQDYNYDEYFVRNLSLTNAGVTPTPEGDGTATVTGTPSSPAPALGTALPQGVAPTPLPSLTPFPTPSAEPAISPTPGGLTFAGGDQQGGAGQEETEQGLLQRVATVDTGRFSQAFWMGVRLAFYLFALLALYLLLRGLLRRLWRQLRTKVIDGR